jgi:glycosyltransferase involved in cell wall biosynthesis
VKINILYDFKDSPWGGGNQFLKNIRNYFFKNGVYWDNPLTADVILVNSKDNLDIASKFNPKVFIHRIDGIFSIYRGERERYNDLMVYEFSSRYASGIIYQSEWSRSESKKNGMSDNKEAVIYNCSDPKIFNRENMRDLKRDKIRLITTCWSDNPKKGGATYKYLDENLNFNKYEYVFAGRCSDDFKNIKALGIMSSLALSQELKKSDIFVTATESDACSNSLIEALTCGLPCVVLNSGGSPEILGGGGELFSSSKDIIEKIETIALHIEKYRNQIIVSSIDEIGKKYYDFISMVYNEKQN